MKFLDLLRASLGDTQRKHVWGALLVLCICVLVFAISRSERVTSSGPVTAVLYTPTWSHVVTATTTASTTVNYAPPEEILDIGVQPYLVQVKWLPTAENITIDCNNKPGPCNGLQTYHMGTITNGQLAQSILYMRAEGDMGGSYYRFFVMRDDKVFMFDTAKFTVQDIDTIPTEITYPGSSYKMKKWYSAQMFFSELGTTTKVFTIDGVGDFYLTSWGCIMLKLKNGTAIAYDFEIPFVNRENGSVNATFGDGTHTNEQYEYTRIGGCGAICLYLSDVDSAKLSALRTVATTSTGEKLYTFVSASSSELLNLYNDKNTMAYYRKDSFESLAENRYTYAQYLAYRPLLYWYDPLGRLIEFKNKRFLFAAEKCKPVIYLYPRTTTDLTVKVTPNGGFLKTIPQYPSGGWKVTAHPNGRITDRSTGESYPYLYWSGVGLKYPPHTKEGWIVKKENIAQFLDEKLAVLGLNSQEIADFKEYWVAKLSESPYYQLSFLPQKEMDQMSPLEIIGAHPDTVIRVMLTASPVRVDEMSSRQVTPQTLITPKRQGFVVAEWGGAILK